MSARGQPLPDTVKNAPELTVGLELYWFAFQNLVNDRSIGVSVGPISWTTIEDYADRIGVSEDQREALHHHIGKMDVAFIEFKKR